MYENTNSLRCRLFISLFTPYLQFKNGMLVQPNNNEQIVKILNKLFPVCEDIDCMIELWCVSWPSALRFQPIFPCLRSFLPQILTQKETPTKIIDLLKKKPQHAALMFPPLIK